MPIIFGSFNDILYQWEALGVFDFILPFLLIFAIVYGILTTTKWLGDNRGIDVVIAFVIGLMSLRWRFFLSDFLSELFPRLGIGIAVMLAILILVGLFIARDEARYWGWGLAALSGAIAIIVLWQTFDRLGYFFGSYIGSDTAGLIVLAIILIGIIIAIGASGGQGRRDRRSAIFAGWPRNGVAEVDHGK